jgi:hypothetical protein
MSNKKIRVRLMVQEILYLFCKVDKWYYIFVSNFIINYRLQLLQVWFSADITVQKLCPYSPLGSISVVVSTWSDNEVLQNIHNLVSIQQNTLLSNLQTKLVPYNFITITTALQW